MTPPVIVTGAAGFIGFHVARRLLERGDAVLGLDSFSDYYDPALKEARFARLREAPGFVPVRADLAEEGVLDGVLAEHGAGTVIHLAAQPGVRYALTDPHAYARANLAGFLNVLEACRRAKVRHLVYASSSSVYGSNARVPFAESDPVDHPISLYAATKRSNELMAHAYAHLFGVPVTGLRFFTVYGPWGRPDMAIYTFTDRIARGLPIDVAAAGQVERDFTFIDDAVEIVIRLLDRPPSASEAKSERPNESSSPFRLFNVGGDRPENLDTVVRLIEAALGRGAVRRDMPLPPGDVEATRADTGELRAAIGTVPNTPLADGIGRFVEWYREYHPLPA